VFLALDKMIQIYEQLGAPMKAIFNTLVLLYYTWVIPYVIISIIIAIIYFKFMMRLPKLILKRFIVAGILFVKCSRYGNFE
jgi:E3 ubiquitin-protein ligase DOA10